MSDIRVIATGLSFPEGPVAMADGSIVLVEIERQTVSRVRPDGRVEVVAHTGGGPNGMAVGPDGAFYVCNNGGFAWQLIHGLLRPAGPASDFTSGRIERVDPATGKVERLYDSCNGHKLRGPNDIVFDAHGGCYFSDLGKSRARDRDHGGLYYALADGSKIVEVAYPILTPNGVALSPDGSVVYVAETETARLWAFDVVAPGVVRKQPFPSPHGGRLVVGLGGYQRFDSLAVDALGNICVATLITGTVTSIAPDGRIVRQVTMPDPVTTNICFGGADLRTAFVTLSGTGRLVALAWPEAGLRLNYNG
ncbi:MAG TPA: SMP-30/gluconolactonase/LRE family protein [Acetobacteraceae bacterium]|jgi:gluconolactonase|nr:SMP-30/gluconolactonase/LRE family protein [Acetobacteraceae bacterium]